MLELLAIALISLVTVVFVGLILYARWNYGVLEKMGVPVNKPHFILGNTYHTFDTPAGLVDIDNFKRHGPVYGVYEGRQPQLHICDAELIRLITSKDSDYFNDKRRVEFRDPLMNEFIDFQPYEKWRTLRSNLTPMFSSAKIRLMSDSMMLILESFSSNIKDVVESSPGHKLTKYDLRSEIFTMLTDMLAKCCFSVKIENPSDPDHIFVNTVRGLLEPGTHSSPIFEILSYSFPFLSKVLPSQFDSRRTLAFKDIFLQMMETRRKSGQKNKDAVDLCIDLMDKLDTPEFKRLNITEYSIVTLGFSMFLAGQDQLSSITATMLYYMLENPEVEKRLCEELDTFLDKHNGKIEYGNIHELQYLLACLYETLRLVPFFNRTERVCTKDWKNEEFNLDIKKGMVIQIPIWAANRNPKYFPDPEKFIPDRFLPENKDKLHPYAFVSFGFGPRNCVAQKFSFDMMLLLSAVLLKNFKISLRNDSEPVYVPAGPFFTPHMPFYFDVTLKINQ